MDRVGKETPRRMTLKGQPQDLDINSERSPDWDRLKGPFPPMDVPPPGSFGSYFQHAPFPMPDLLTIKDIMAICQLNKPAAVRFVKHDLPDYAVVGFRQKLRVHSWALAHVLKMADQCPGCGQPWKDGHGLARRRLGTD